MTISGGGGAMILKGDIGLFGLDGVQTYRASRGTAHVGDEGIKFSENWGLEAYPREAEQFCSSDSQRGLQFCTGLLFG